MGETWSNEKIISDVLGRGADIDIGGAGKSWCLSRWRQFVGAYELPALPNPTFVVHIAGTRNVKTWMQSSWSETCSIPGCATIVPAGRPSGWLVDGELDVVTLSIDKNVLQTASGANHFEKLRFAFSDPLGVALTRQVLSELYAPQDEARRIYLSTLVETLTAHMIRGPNTAAEVNFPTSNFSAFRLHEVMNSVIDHPEEEHTIEAMAGRAGLSPSHFCRVFKQATRLTPHQFVMKTRLEKAQEMLTATSLSIAEISEALGFNSQSYFTRAFREFTGRPPGIWRNGTEA